MKPCHHCLSDRIGRLAQAMLCMVFAALSMTVTAQTESVSTNPTAIIQTSLGDITVELFQDRAPASVENFMQYAQSGFYDGTIFHRVISYFMIQGGGMTPDMLLKPTAPPITNEADNGLSNTRGTLAMARTGDPHSATSQFFINVQDNLNLDHTGKNSPQAWGYAVFGKVIDGMKVVDDIRFSATDTIPPHSDVPRIPVVIKAVEIRASGSP